MRFPRLLLFVLPLFILSCPARAQNVLAGFSETEKVGFAFYHLINRDPPVEEWIMNRTDYLKAVPTVQMQILDNDRTRLQEGYANYFVDRDLISVKVSLVYDVSDNPDYKTNVDVRARGLIKRIKIRFPEGTGGPYFPFQLGKLWIGLIPSDIESIFQQDMDSDQYAKFCQSVGDCFNFKDKSVPTVIVMRPTKADIKTPFMDSGIPIWLMTSDVGALYIRNEGKDIEWSYSASWYDSKQAQEFMSLKGTGL